MVAGWNLVGYAGRTNGDVGTDWAPQVTAGGVIDSIIRWNVTSQAFEHYHFVSDAMALEIGRGYFVWRHSYNADLAWLGGVRYI